jgi:CheY-like chemotaxis protein
MACILVVEDDFDLRDSLRSLLIDEGFEVATATNGIAALEWLRNNPAPQTILLDLMMPLMTGEQFFAELSRDPSLANLPVVVLSAMNDEQQRAAVPGAAAWLRKPVGIADLLAALGR